MNSTTPNVICIVLNKRYFAFTFPIDFAMVMSPQATSGLDGVSASRHKNEAQTQYSLYHPCLLGVPMVGRNQPSKEWMWWQRAKNGRKLVKLGENTNIPYSECEESIKIPVVKQQ